jgi:NADH-quinone oxidoreductase subunit K
MEIILNAASINFMAFARLYGEASGQVFAMLTVGVLALELLVALVIVAAVCSRWKSERPDDDKYLSSQVDY